MPGTGSVDAGISSGEQTQNGRYCFLGAWPAWFRMVPRGGALVLNSGVGAVGLTGLEPVTLRLSSACSNQLSYRPWDPDSFFLWKRNPAELSVRGRGGGKGIRTPDL